MIPENNWPDILLQWFDRNRRDLPWRENHPRNPYHVWVSEIMLQQTRTEAVKPYFICWMKQFPTVAALAHAEESAVLRAWQGLGYYSRARNLHKAARQVVLEYNGKLPEDKALLEKLPGIGAYTAGAICSMAFGQQVPAVDGNLLRVFARLYAVEEEVTAGKGKKIVAALAEKAMPPVRCGDFNEALMDLGAEICIPKAPRCADCPLSAQCRAYAEHLTEKLPVRKQKAPQKEFFAAVGIFVRDGRFLLYRRPEDGMLASMWEFPMVLSEKNPEGAKKILEENMQGKAGEIFWTHKHVFTHQIWHMTAYVMESGRPFPGPHRYLLPKEWTDYPLAGPHVKLADALQKALKKSLFPFLPNMV